MCSVPAPVAGGMTQMIDAIAVVADARVQVECPPPGRVSQLA